MSSARCCSIVFVVLAVTLGSLRPAAVHAAEAPAAAAKKKPTKRAGKRAAAKKEAAPRSTAEIEAEQLQRALALREQENLALSAEKDGLAAANERLLVGDFGGAAGALTPRRGPAQKLDASRAFVALAVIQGQPQHLEKAQTLLAEVQNAPPASDGDPRPEGPADLQRRIDEVQRDLETSRAALYAYRRSQGELIAGGVMAGVFLGGALMFARSAAWNRALRGQIALESAQDPEAPLRGLRRSAEATETQMVASALVSTFALVLATTLISLGVRDRAQLRELRRSRFR